MGLSEYLALAKDVCIVAAVGFLVFFVYHSGANSVRVHDIEAVQKQIAANAAIEARHHDEINDAFAEANSQFGNIAHSIDAQRKPVIVRIPPSSRAVPGEPATSVDPDPSGGGLDVRLGINAFERKYESALSQCRALNEAAQKVQQ